MTSIRGAEPIPAISCIKKIQTLAFTCLFNWIGAPPANQNFCLLECESNSRGTGWAVLDSPIEKDTSYQYIYKNNISRLLDHHCWEASFWSMSLS